MNKILILDDDIDILEILCILLSESGYETKGLSSGELVFETITDFQPDLILMDVFLAELDGRVICQNIKENRFTHDLPVILVSATPGLAQSLLQQGAPNDYVSKPFDIDYLLDVVEKQLALH